MGKVGITKAAKTCDENRHFTGGGRDLNKTYGQIEKSRKEIPGGKD